MVITPYSRKNQVGVIRGEPNEVYHDADALSSTGFKECFTSFADFEASRSGRKPKRDSSGFSIGTAAHKLIIEGEKSYLGEYSVIPNNFPEKPTESSFKSFRNGGKTKYADECAVWDDFMAENEGKEIISSKDNATVKKMCESALSVPQIKELLSDGFPELTFRTGKVKGLNFGLQCRFDWINFNGCELTGGKPYFVDMKTTSTQLPAKRSEFEFVWSRQMAKYDYFYQGAFYNYVADLMYKQGLIDVPEFVYIVIPIETIEPHKATWCVPDPSEMILFHNKVDSTLLELIECYKTNSFAGIDQPTDLNSALLSAPKWKLNQTEEE